MKGLFDRGIQGEKGTLKGKELRGDRQFHDRAYHKVIELSIGTRRYCSNEP
jgi:hypothetical protein